MGMRKGQSAPIYWIVFMAMIFGIILMVTYLSPMFETMSSLTMNLTSHMRMNGSTNTTVSHWINTWNVVPLILVVGLLFAMIVVAQKREYDTGGYYG